MEIDKMRGHYPNIVNIKVSVKISFPYCPNELFDILLSNNISGHPIRRVRNMIIAKSAKESFILLSSKKGQKDKKEYHCNITGIEDFPSLSLLDNKLRKVFNINFTCDYENIMIDNITSKYEIGSHINLRKIYTNVESELILNKKLNLQVFPSLKLRFKDLGCVQLYSSGKCLFLGQKSISDSIAVKFLILDILKHV